MNRRANANNPAVKSASAPNSRTAWICQGTENGVDPITLANLMGHVDTAMIARVYSHIAQGQTFMQQQGLKAVRA